jgi:two-component system, NtrC family, nitrogen regulation sensor histidine kinase NtrY
LFTTLHKYKWIELLVCISCFILAYRIDSQETVPDVSKTAQSVTERLGYALHDIDQLLSDSNVLTTNANGTISYLQQNLSSKPFFIYGYFKDSMVYWSSNNCLPPNPPSEEYNKLTFVKLSNGYYFLYKPTPSVNKANRKNISYLTLIPFYHAYSIDNSYLQSGFDDYFHVDNRIVFSPVSVNSSSPVFNPINPKEALFYIYFNKFDTSGSVNIWSAMFFLLGFLLLLNFLSTILSLLPPQGFSFLRLFILLVLCDLLLLFIYQKTYLPEGIRNWYIFDPGYYASSQIAVSLGNLFIESIVIYWLAVFFRNKINLTFDPRDFYLRVLIYSIYWVVIFLLSFYIVKIFQSLVIDSNITFNLFNPFNPELLGLVGILSLILIFFSYFLISQKLVFNILDKRHIFKSHFLSLTIAIGISALVYSIFDIMLSWWIVVLWVALFISLLSINRISKGAQSGFVRVILLLVFFSLTGASMLNYYSSKKDVSQKLGLANKLSNQRDNVMEYLLNENRAKVASDEVVQNYFSTENLTMKNLTDHLYRLYFNTGFNRFKISFFALDKNGQPLESDAKDVKQLNTTLENKKPIPEQPGLFYFISKSGDFCYYTIYDIVKNEAIVGKLGVKLTARRYLQANVYPELLLEEKNKIPETAYSYSYAIYKNNLLVSHNGNYSYSSYYSTWPKPAISSFQNIIEGGYDHFIFRSSPTDIIIISSNHNKLNDFISHFSYFFSIAFALIVIIIIARFATRYYSKDRLVALFFNASLREYIQVSFIVLIVFSVLIIGLLTVKFFRKQYSQATSQSVLSKIQSISELSTYFLSDTIHRDTTQTENTFINSRLRSRVDELADIEDIDVNFFDLSGNLITTSQPGVFDNGLISKKINPEAYITLSHDKKSFLQLNQSIGQLSFLSVYQPLFGPNGKVQAYVNVPYFESEKSINEQIGFFFSLLINLAAFAIIITGLFAPFLSNQITRKLSIVAERFKLVNISKRNELIIWPSNDEVGALVKEFNKIILKLEDSAQMLAKSEREIAWREMAKQVAHEIKNTLTPMKLSIQFLQRSLNDNSPDIKEQTKRLTSTLVEQVENLSQIASEFSSFAKMPQPENEILDLNKIIASDIRLFDETENVSLHFYSSQQPCTVLADKNQMLRVFNNIILNAIQSIPVDRRGRIDINTSIEQGWVEARVKDNGKGITDYEHGKIFMPNFTTKSSGTGLGLAICKMIIDNSGGEITFESAPEIGTTFIVRLPLIRVS